jgi:hypothetical protein
LTDEACTAAAVEAAVGQTPQAVRRLHGGANNQVFLVELDGGAVVAKLYFTHAADPRDRLGTEFGTLSFLWSRGIRSIPRPLAMSREHHVGVYEYVEGRRMETATLEDGLALGELLVRMRAASQDPEAGALRAASEGVFTVDARLRQLDGRLGRLRAALATRACGEEARTYVEAEVAPAVAAVRGFVEDRATGLDVDLSAEVAPSDRTLSPGDIGFHNALRRGDGRLCFLDFEYAGWDDTAQVLAQTCLAPEVPLSRDHELPLLRELLPRLAGDRDAVAARVRLLYPVLALKWAMIMLNEFLAVDAARREFARTSAEERRRRQVGKSRGLVRVALESAQQRFLDHLLAERTPGYDLPP